MYYHQHCVEIHLEVKNVLPRRDHGLAGAYCGRCRHPDVHVWESSPLPPSRSESIPRLGHCHHHHQPDVLVSFIHAFSRVAVFCIRGHQLAPWLHITIMAPPWPMDMDMELWICLYSMFDIQTCIQLCFAFVAIIPPHMAPPRLWLRPHKIPASSLDHLLTLKTLKWFPNNKLYTGL